MAELKLVKKSIEPFKAKITFGKYRGYTDEIITEYDFIRTIQQYQEKLIKDKNIFLSVSVSNTVIVLSGQEEPHFVLNFINYPKFPLDIKTLKTEIELFIENLMVVFKQNRVVIEYLDETMMLEFSDDIDPKINTYN